MSSLATPETGTITCFTRNGNEQLNSFVAQHSHYIISLCGSTSPSLERSNPEKQCPKRPQPRDVQCKRQHAAMRMPLSLQAQHAYHVNSAFWEAEWSLFLTMKASMISWPQHMPWKAEQNPFQLS
jgi:hypothetical protein